MSADTVTAWAASPVGGATSAALGAGLGILLSWAVDAWYGATGDERVSRHVAARVAIGAACIAGLLWWWEICRVGGLGLVSGQPIPMGSDGEAHAVRYLAHLVFFWLLAAATWIDLRQRVIPDWITVPGVILGLATAWAWPRSLLPITVEVPRTFAPPALQSDVLAWYGGLHVDGGGMFGDAPRLLGLGLATLIFFTWWLVCTEPDGDARPRVPCSPRVALLPTGLLAIAAAWWAGGERFDALQSALLGMLVSGGLVWTVRAGASAALGQEAMGLGDVTLMAMVGAWLGWQPCVLTFFLAAFIGLGHGVVQLIRHRDNELPFGPSLCLAAALVVVAWRWIWQVTGVHFEHAGQLALVVTTVVVLTAATLFVWRWLRRER